MSKLLVTGATGQLGQSVLRHLIETLNVEPTQIVAASRQPEKLADWAARGVETRALDFNDAETLATGFAGIDRALIISSDQIGTRLASHQRAIAAAVKAGVKHLLYTSMPEPENSRVLFAPEHLGTEQAIQASGVPGWTILRNHWYFENLFMSIPPALAQGGKWYSAAGQGKIAHISRDDLGRAAATALARAFDGQATLTLSGAKAYTTEEIAAIVGASLGQPIDVVHVPVEAIEQGLIGAGFPEPMAKAFASFDTNTAEGYVGTVTSDYRDLTGTEPLDFSAWVAHSKEAFLKS